MIRVLLFLLVFTLWSCGNSSPERPAPPPDPPTSPAAPEADAPAPAPAAPNAPAPSAPPAKAAPAVNPAIPSNPREADLTMAMNTTTDLQLVSKKGFVTKDGILIQGKVKNTTDRDFHFVEISFKLFDKDKKELAVIRTTTDSLEAGRSWYFELKAPYPTAATSVLERLGGF